MARERLRIGEVADLLGISTNALRYYHEIGLVPEPGRSANGYRLYGPGDLLLLQRVRRLRAMGLSIEAVRRVLGGPEDDESRLRAALEALAQETEARVVELKSRAESIRKALKTGELESLSGSLSVEPPEDLDVSWQENEPVYEDPHAKRFLRRLEAALGLLRWPRKYWRFAADLSREAEKLVAAHPEIEGSSRELEERFAALAGLPEDSPEVERLVENYLQYERDYPYSEEELDEFWIRLLDRHGIEAGDRFLAVARRLFLGTFSPAQKRAAELLRIRKQETYGRGASDFVVPALERRLGSDRARREEGER